MPNEVSGSIEQEGVHFMGIGVWVGALVECQRDSTPSSENGRTAISLLHERTAVASKVVAVVPTVLRSY